MSEYGINKPLLKYLPREHALSLVNKGGIRVGTLYDYRNMEKYGSAIGDEAEGRRSYKLRSESKVVHIENYSVEKVKIKGLSIYGAKNALVHDLVGPNFYLYCTSYLYSERTMKAFKADTCVVIYNTEYFFHHLSLALADKGLVERFPLVEKCVYQDKDIVLSEEHINYTAPANNTPIWLQKDMIYDYQAEVRALWVPKYENPEPVILQCEALTKVCSILK